MNKKLAKFIGGTLIGVSLLTVSASARQIGNLNSLNYHYGRPLYQQNT